MSFEYKKFESFVDEITGLPPNQVASQKEDLVKKAEAFGKDIKQLSSKDKKASIIKIQEAQRNLYQQIGQSEHSISAQKAPPSKVAAKIEILRTMLYGSGLEEMPSISRFKAFVDLANSRAKSIVDATGYSEEIENLQKELQGTGLDESARKEKEERLALLKERVEQWRSAGLKPRDETVGSDTFTVWSVPESYLFFGCADTPSTIMGFVDQLLKSEYYETLCTSAITEDTGFFKEDTRLFLMMHVNPDSIVHTQEKDIRSPRFSEDMKWQRTEWYDVARRNVHLTGQIDSAHRAFIGVCLPQLFGEEPTTDPVSTDLDRFNRLKIRVDGLPKCIGDRILSTKPKRENFLRLYQRLELLSSFEETLKEVTRNELESALRELRLIDGALSEHACPEDKSPLGSMMNIGEFLNLSIGVQKILLERVLFQQLSKGLNSEPFRKLKNALDYSWYCNRLQETLSLLESVAQENRLGEENGELLGRLELLFNLQNKLDPAKAILSKSQQEALEKLYFINLAKHFENALDESIQENCTFSLKHGLAFISSDLKTDDPDEFQQNLRGEIEKLKQKIGETTSPSDWYRKLNVREIFQKVEDARPEEGFETLIQEVETVDDVEQFMQHRSNIRNKSISETPKQLEEDLELFTSYRERFFTLGGQFVRIQLLDALEGLANAEKTPLVKRAIAILRREENPLNEDEVDAVRAELKKSKEIWKTSVHSLLGWEPLDKVMDILKGRESKTVSGINDFWMLSEIQDNPHQANRSRFQLSKLIEWIAERKEKLEGDENFAVRKEVYTTLFGEEDTTEKYDILERLKSLEEGFRAIPKSVGKVPEGRGSVFFSL
ncbi:MAG: hypothetical protein ACE5GN_04070, partial [Waddliaceae bacterium]